jgi:hypothetical protein
VRGTATPERTFSARASRCHLRRHARTRVERQIDLFELHLGRASDPLVADDPLALTIDQEKIGALVSHAVDELVEGLLVDPLRIERGVHRGAEVAQQRELLDLGAEIAELLLELEARIDDLVGLHFQELLKVPSTVMLENRVTEGAAAESRQRDEHGRRRPEQLGRGCEEGRESRRGRDPGRGRHPEPDAK